MPTPPGNHVIDMPQLRHYLRTAVPADGADIMKDAFISCEPGAMEIISFCLQLRGNPRTRRSVTAVGTECRRLHRNRAATPPDWYQFLVNHVMGMFRQWRTYAYPHGGRLDDSTLTHSLSRRDRRALGYSGTVQVTLPTLQSQATAASQQLFTDMGGQSVVVWFDNWYCERYGTSFSQPVLSTDLTAVAVLLLTSSDDTAASRTRRQTAPPYAGPVGLHHMAMRIATVDTDVQDAAVALLTAVHNLTQLEMDGSEVRVPLDVSRPSRTALQWRPMSLAEHRVSSNVELLHFLDDIRALRSTVNGPMPLLVDEKIYYTVSRMLHSRVFVGYDVAGWLKDMPLLYGVWHPYKYALTVVYRRFFPVFALLESTGEPNQNVQPRVHRKVVFMEKLFAAILLCGHRLHARLVRALATAEDGSATQNCVNSHHMMLLLLPEHVHVLGLFTRCAIAKRVTVCACGVCMLVLNWLLVKHNYIQ